MTNEEFQRRKDEAEIREAEAHADQAEATAVAVDDQLTPEQIVDSMIYIDPKDPTKLLLGGPTDKVCGGFPDAMTIVICTSDTPLVLNVNGNMAKRIIYQGVVAAVAAAKERIAKNIESRFTSPSEAARISDMLADEIRKGE